MKTKLAKLLGLLALLWATGAAAQTTNTNMLTLVLFSTQFFTGQALNNTITVVSANTPYSIQTGLVAGQVTKLQPVNGVAVTNLFPGDYQVMIDGTVKSFIVTIPLTTNVVNAAASLKAGTSGLDVWIWTNTIPFTLIVTQQINVYTFTSSNVIDTAAGTNVVVSTNAGLRTVSLTSTLTNEALVWQMTAPSVINQLVKTAPNELTFQYQSGSIQKIWHMHDNFFHFDAAPYFDYPDFGAAAWFDFSGRLQSVPNPAAPGAFTNDSNGNLGWFGDFVPDLNGSVTNLSVYHNDPLGNLMLFNGNEFWSTNFSSILPVGRFLGSVAGAGLVINGQLIAAKPANYSIPPFIIDYSSTFASDMFDVRSNGLVVAKMTSDAYFNALMRSTNLINYGTPVSSPNTSFALSEQMGANASAGAILATAFGNQATASGSSSSAFGGSSLASGANSSAFGELATASASSSTALGFSTTAAFSKSVAVGNGSTTTRANQVMAGDSSVIEISIGGAASIFRGAGSPAGAVSAPVGSLYLNTSGGAGTTLYVKESGGSGNTGWVGK
jgi:hypothetical protein